MNIPLAGKREPVFSDSITLEEPVRRGETTIGEVRVRRPGAGELRGLNLLDLGQMNVDALIKALPRVTSPPLFEPEVAALDPADLMALGVEVSAFLLGRQARSDSPAT